MLFSSVEKPPRLSEFEMEVPEERIAQHPSKKRDNCKLMVLNRKDHSIEHKKFNSNVKSWINILGDYDWSIFIDDVSVNVRVADNLGMNGILFVSVKKLIQELRNYLPNL